MEPDKNYNVSAAADYLVGDTSEGKDLLERLKGMGPAEGEKVVYGIYNNSGKSIFVKLNDFLIDRSKVTLRDKSYFFHMLAVMVDSGIPVLEAIQSLSNRVENKRFSRVLNTVAYDCERGANLSDAMARFEDVFDEAEIGIVRSGEATGRLHQMLFQLSSQLEKRYELYVKIRAAAAYPMVVLAVLVVVAVGMMIWVLPALFALLEHGGIAREALPLSTRILLGIQSVFAGFWWLILLVLVGVYGLFVTYKNSDYGAARWDYRKLTFFAVGDLLKKLYVQRFVSMLGMLVDSGLPVMKALAISGNSLENRMYKLKIQEVINDVGHGKKISESLSDAEFLVPAEVVQMIAVGEKSAGLGEVCKKIANKYEMELDNSLKKMTSVFEPVMILVVGLFVGLVAMSIMAPIFNLANIVG